MKKLLLFISSLTFVLTNYAQSSISITDNGGMPIANNATIAAVTTVGGLPDENDFTLKNISSTSKDYNIIRIDNKLTKISSSDSAEAYFCFGTACFPATTTITPTPYTFASNGTGSLKTYLQEASVQGYSSVTYKVVNATNSSDVISFTIQYNSALSVKENGDLFSSVSNVYPNPAIYNAHIKIQSSANVKSAEVKVINTLGTVVLSNSTDLNIGENTINIHTENLPAGIYFSTISYGKNKVVKKFTIYK
ncbi:MAG: T9SS type A sorting domain-containing protein [Burkholderiales bacterium]|nr:T9SS type A sorting domain-containing protein [Bacteroidia bacterium]